MTDDRTSESDTGTADTDPRFDPAPVFGDGHPAVHPGHPALRRALDHAPDRGSEPDDELRQAIRSFAHESVAPSLPSGRTGLLGRRAGEGATGLEARTRARRSRLLRNLIVAAVLVVIVATVTWHREPGPGNVRPAATAPEAAVEPVAPTASAASAAAAVATANAPASAAAGAPALSEAEKILFAPRVTLPEPASPAASAPSRAPKVATPSMPSTAPTSATPAATTPTPTTPPAAQQPKTSMAALPSTPAPVSGTSPGAAAERAKGAAASAAATATPVTPPVSPATTPAGRAAASFAAPGGTGAAPAGSAATPSTAAKPAADAAPPSPPTFAALSQWTQLTMTRADGTTRRRSKADARELGALLGSAALAGGGAEPIRGRVDWRVSLERNGQTLARVELAGNQVRWIENNAAPGTGTPPAGSLDSVREMLENVFEEPASGGASKLAPLVPVEVQSR
ncbi:hypothetical protein [Variovorax sp. PvP013]|uniref:hypothetical protein n=1 Tax=Variovorax sp. PvP013 TaxID=3156435 RepID=UPI003D1B966E